MAISFVAERWSVAQSASGNDLVSGSFTPNANALLVLAMHVSESITSISGHDGGGAWAQIGTTLDCSGRDIQVWACHTGASPSAGTVTIVIPYNWHIAVSLCEFTGVDVSGSVTASFGTPVTQAGSDLRGHYVDLADYADPGNATLMVGLTTGGAVVPWDSQLYSPEWFTNIGGAATNGTIGVAWCNFENDGAVQMYTNWYINTGLFAVEMKAATPATVSTRYVGNGTWGNSINPYNLVTAMRGISFSPAANGTLGSVWAVCQDNDVGGRNFCAYLYDTSGNLLDQSALKAVTGNSGIWYEFTGMTYSLVAGTTYYLGIAAASSTQMRLSRLPTSAYFGSIGTADNTFSNLSSPPDPATISAHTADDFSIYAEYAPSAGGTNYSQSVGGAFSPVGAAVKRTFKAFVGTITPAGAENRQTGKQVAGAITPAGAENRQTGKQVTGSSAPTGVLFRSTSKQFAGAITPTGDESASIVYTTTATGSITPSGGVIKRTLKAVAGIFVPTGAASRRTGKGVAGSTAPAGTIARDTSKQVAGATTPTGDTGANVTSTQEVTGLLAVISGTLNAVKLIPPTVSGAVTRAFRLMGTLLNRR